MRNQADPQQRAGERMAGPLLWFRAARPFSWPCSLMPVMVVTAAALPVGRWRLDVLAVTLAAVLGLHVAANLLNDYFDYVQGVDRPAEGDADRPGRALVRGLITPPQVLRAAGASLGVAAACTAWLTWRAGPPVLAFAGAGFLGSYFYTAPPLRLKARGLGELAMLVFFGPALAAGVCYVQRADVPPRILLLSLPLGLAVSLILSANNLRDFEEDAAGGVRTLAHRLGRPALAGLYAAMALACPAGLAAVGIAYGTPLLALCVAALALIVDPLRAVLSGRRLPDIDARTARFMVAMEAVALGTLLWSGGL